MDPLAEIKQTFFQECDELLADLEAGLMAMDAGEADGEVVNAVFRAVHSVKGGAGAFGLEALVRFAHAFETTLDAIRNGQLTPDGEVVRVLLKSADRLSDHVANAKLATPEDIGSDEALVRELEELTGVSDDGIEADPGVGFTPVLLSLDPVDAPFAPVALDILPLIAGPVEWRIEIRPRPSLYANANDPALLLRELARLGELEVALDCESLVGFGEYDPFASYLGWTVRLTTEAGAETIREVFEFVEGDLDLVIAPTAEPEPSAPSMLELPADPVEVPLSLEAILAAAKATAEPLIETDDDRRPAVVRPASDVDSQKSDARKTSEGSQATIRVDLDRVDRLINLVGELVINQAMLAQKVNEAGLSRAADLGVGLDDLELLTREIQDSVMAIRAQPVKSVFQRMPRLVREVAAMTGKSVRLVTEGEGTEVDKTVIERLSDPLTHMIRNAIDHGLETPEARVAAGKPSEGVIRLSAQHRSGRIIIEVSDDGRGIDRQRVRAIAVERGLIGADDVLSDEEVDNLIFAPGFSTADQLSDISGRGVGMDVVKRSIQALGGRISISSTPGKGSTFNMSLPLTLAVLDGMVVTVGEQTVVVPISVIVETLQPRREDIHPLGVGGVVLAVRGSHVPLIDVGEALGFAPATAPTAGVTILVESEGGALSGMRVDAIQGQRQVVIKSLEQNYAQVPGIGAATILGDGRVALILDVDATLSLHLQAGQRSAPLSLAS